MSKSSSQGAIAPVPKVLKQSVGIDVSKSSIAACFAQQEIDRPFRILSNRSFATTPSGLQSFHTWIQSQHKGQTDLHVVMEATGVYYEQWAYFVRSKGYRVSVVLPSKTAAYAKSLNHKSKTDKIDAQKLAQLSLERTLPIWELPSDNMLTIKRLCRERAELVNEKVALANRLHARQYAYAPNKSSLKRGQAGLNFLKKQIKEIESAIKQTIAKDPDIQQRMSRVMSITGIGLVSAATVVSEANGFNLFKNKAQLVSYAGYDVIEYSSGESVQKIKRISKIGNPRIRKALYFAALVAVKSQGQFKNLFQRVLDTTKIKMKAYVAVQRKLLVLTYTLYKNNKDFDPNYATKSPMKNLKPGI
jgi:transposase